MAMLNLELAPDPSIWMMFAALDQRLTYDCAEAIALGVMIAGTAKTLVFPVQVVSRLLARVAHDCNQVFTKVHILSFSVVLPGCTHGALQLVGGDSISEGRLEICINGEWGTVCDDSWGTHEAMVACSQLGFSAWG